MKIIGVSAYYHDSAASLVIDGEIVASAQEERFTRKKHDPEFPEHAMNYCLEHAGLTLSDIDQFVFYDKPFLKFERLLETHYAFSPKGLKTFLKAMPVWLQEKLFLKEVLTRKLKELAGGGKIPKVYFSEHHLSHAASAFFPSPFEEAAVLTVDGVGEWATTTISHGKGNGIEMLKELNFPHSWGLLYSAFTYYLGFRVNSGEYKLMGLAPYGDPESPQTLKFIEQIKETLIDLKPDGSLWLNLDYFNYPVGLTMTVDNKWEKLFALARREPEAEITQEHMNLGFAIQKVTEEGVMLLAKEAQRATGSRNLTLAGGVALNCVANGKLLRSGIFDNVWIQPAAGDAGGALGAALASWYIHQDQPRQVVKPDAMQGSYLGPEFSHIEIEQAMRKHGLVAHRLVSFDQIAQETASHLNEGRIVGWMQGRMEWGPRALGNRSILADPRNAEMQRKLNLKIKYRESFRPFAPSVLAEHCENYFAMGDVSPYMLLVADVVDGRREPLPDNYHQLPMREKLYHLRSDVPAITHLDFSARVQTVHEETNPKYFQMIKEFEKLSGCPMVVNTSFNVRGEPIVCTPEDAMRCFMRTEMDVLVVENYIFLKTEQTIEMDNKLDWQQEYPLD